MKILIVKISSMGDIIHALPALNDAVRAIPNIQFDWVVEEGFAEIPSWHPRVNKIITIALRRWRKNFWRSLKSGEIKKFLQELRATKYDLIIDAQGLPKSAFIALLAKGVRAGFDGPSTRGRLTSIFYQKQYPAAWTLHAITRIRLLFAQALGYHYQETFPDYGIGTSHLMPAPMILPPEFLLFVPNTTWVSKLWPEEYWCELIRQTTQAGHTVFIPWGNIQEYERAKRFAAMGVHNRAQVLPRLKLAEMATVLSKAKAAVFVDTGLAHLAIALKVPGVFLYGPTDSKLVGAFGDVPHSNLQANFSCSPCDLRRCNYRQPSAEKPACFTTLPPAKVFQELAKLISNRSDAIKLRLSS